MPFWIALNAFLLAALTGLTLFAANAATYGANFFFRGKMILLALAALNMLMFHAWGIDPFLAVVPVALAFFVLGYLLQRGLINPFITRPEHSQFMLLVAVAIIMVNGLLIAFGPNARNVQVDYQLESFEIGPLLVDAALLGRGDKLAQFLHAGGDGI